MTCFFLSFLICKTVKTVHSVVDDVKSVVLNHVPILGEVRGVVKFSIPDVNKNSGFWMEIKLVQFEKDNLPPKILLSSIVESIASTGGEMPFFIRYNPSLINISKTQYALLINVYDGKELLCKTQNPYSIFKEQVYEKNVKIILYCSKNDRK